MKIKKVLSIFVVLCMIVNILPVFATAESSADTISAFQWIINDQFEEADDVADWQLGRVKTGVTADRTLTWGTAPDGSGALVFHSGAGHTGDGGTEPNIIKQFDEKVSLTEGKTIVIKTRFMQAGDESGNGVAYLRFNQPDNENLLSNSNIPYNYPDMTTKINNANAVCDWFTLLKMDKSALYYRQYNSTWGPTSMANVNTVGKWVDAEIVIKGNSIVTINATIDGTTYTKTDASLTYKGLGPIISYTLYNNPEATEALTEYPSLDSLTWVTQTANDIYIDYVQAYVVTPYTAQITVPGSIKQEGSIDVKFTNAIDVNGNKVLVNNVPEGAVTVEGVETEVNYDESTQTLTFVPCETLTEGSVYKVVIDKEKLAEAGMTYTGETEFNVRVEYTLPEGFYVDDQFNTAGDTQGWVKGAVKSGTAEFTVSQGTAPDGSGALILASEGGSTSSAGQQPNVFKALTDAINFEADKKIVVKTRFMQEGNDSSAGSGFFKFNQPNNIAFSSVDDIKWNWTNTWKRTDAIPSMNGANVLCRWYQVLGFTPNALTYMAPNDQRNWRESTYMSADTLGKWIEATITINGSEDITVSASIDGVEGEVVNGSLNQGLTGPYIAYALNKDNQTATYPTAFTSLDSLTWLTTTKNTIYIDYVQIYEPIAVSAETKETIKEDDAFEFKFTNAEGKTVANIPEDAVAIEGVETEAVYDAETQTLILTPVSSLTGGESYTATVNTASLKDAGFDYIGSTEFTVAVEIKLPEGFYLDDQFNTAGDTQGWVKGAVKSGTAEFTVSQGTAPDGSGALILASEGGSTGNAGQQPNVFKALTDAINFEADKKIVVKTRFMQEGNDSSAGSGFFKFNQPNNIAFSSVDDIKWNWTNTWKRTDAIPSMNGANVLCRWYQVLGFTPNALTYMAPNDQKNWRESTYMSADTLGKWIEATITINGSEDITVSASIDGVEGEVVNGSLNQGLTGPYVAYALNKDNQTATYPTAFTSLDSLTWLTTTKNTIYIDYVQIYEPIAPVTYEAVAVMPQGSTVETADSFELKFIGEVNEDGENVPVSEIPAGAVTVEGVEVTENYDAETQTLTLTPIALLTEGTVYNVTVDAEKLEEAGIIYTGTTEFKVTARGVRSTGVVLNDNFKEGTDGWTIGPAQEGFITTVSTVDDEGAKDGKALKITFPARSGSSESNYGTVTKAVGNGIAFDTAKTITFETRVKKTSASADYNIKVNRPDTLSQIFGDYVYNHYYIAKYDPNPAYPGVDIIGAITGNDISPNANAHWRTSEVDITDKWVTYRFVFIPSEGYYYTDVSYTDENGNEVLMTSNQKGLMKAAKAAIDKEYGVGYYKNVAASAYDANNFFKALERITFSSMTGGDIYVDYVKVMENVPGTAQLLNGKKIEIGDSFKLQFMSDSVMPEVPNGTVTVSGVEVTQSFDAETQTLTLVPKTTLTAGTEYTITVDGTRLYAHGIKYDGTKEFKVTAINPRVTTLGTVVNTNFDDGQTQGWVSGVANENYEATLSAYDDNGTKVLKVVLPKSGDDTNGGNQPLAHFELPAGIKYEENKVTVIKAKVKNVTNTPYTISVNRPDSLKQPANIRQLNGYSVAGQTQENGVNQLVFGTSTLHTYANGNQWRAMLPFNHNENKDKFWFTNVDLANKWVEWEIILDGVTNKMIVSATVEGVDEKLVTWSTENPVSALNPAQVLNYEYGKGTNIQKFYGLDSISFTSASVTDETTLYIDYVTVETKKDRAFVTSSFKVNGTEADGFNYGDKVVPVYTINPVNTDKYVAISAMYVNGVLVEMNTEEIESENNTLTTVESQFSYTVPSGAEVVIKAFVWNTFETMEAISTASSITLMDSIDVYVSANGNDMEGTGELNSPVATLKRGLEIANAKVAAAPKFKGSVNILLDEGVYRFSDNLTINTSKIKVPRGGLFIKNIPGTTPVISGAVEYDINEATKVTDTNILNRLHSDDAKNNLYVLDLTTKVAKEDIPAQSWYGEKSFGVEAMVEEETGVAIPDLTCEAVFDGELMTIARWPNEGTNEEDSVTGGYKWAKTVSGNTRKATKENLTQGFTLGCDYENLDKWATADQALIFGYLNNGWATQTTPLASIGDNTITSKYASAYGVGDMHARYYVFNLMEEIDVPGEYFIDRNSGKMYFYMPENKTAGSKIELSVNTDSLITLAYLSNVTLDGLTFESNLGLGIYVASGKNNTIKNCTFRNISNDAISVFSKNCLVDNNYIYNTNGGILVGSDTPANDAKYLISAENIISNNHIEKYSRLDKVYVDAISCSGVGNKILNNEIHDAAHLAMRVTGQNHLVQYNEIYDVCKEVEDASAIYFGHTWVSRGIKVLNNYIHDIYTNVDTNVPGRSSVAGIFLDDHFAAAHIEGNIFADIYGDGIRSNRGREGYISNNLFINCTKSGIALPAYATDDKASISQYQYQKNGVDRIKNGSVPDAEGKTTYDYEIWYNAFPEIFDTTDEEWVKPEKFTVTNNININTLPGWSGNCLSAGNWMRSLATKIEANETQTADPGFEDMENGDYTIDVSLLKSIVSGFESIDFSKIGRNAY